MASTAKRAMSAAWLGDWSTTRLVPATYAAADGARRAARRPGRLQPIGAGRRSRAAPHIRSAVRAGRPPPSNLGGKEDGVQASKGRPSVESEAHGTPYRAAHGGHLKADLGAI